MEQMLNARWKKKKKKKKKKKMKMRMEVEKEKRKWRTIDADGSQSCVPIKRKEAGGKVKPAPNPPETR